MTSGKFWKMELTLWLWGIGEEKSLVLLRGENDLAIVIFQDLFLC